MERKQLTGKVLSDKMDKTIVVVVERVKQHPKYLRNYRVHEKYKAHDEKNEYKEGDTVVIEETRPLSKDKRWRVMRKITV
ncbi:MAG: 30S ribosomal protein S17 [bacterium]|nr:30S ribosomal protein S17 [bacterium]